MREPCEAALEKLDGLQTTQHGRHSVEKGEASPCGEDPVSSKLVKVSYGVEAGSSLLTNCYNTPEATTDSGVCVRTVHRSVECGRPLQTSSHEIWDTPTCQKKITEIFHRLQNLCERDDNDEPSV